MDGIRSIGSAPPAFDSTPATPAGGGSFGDALADALGRAEALQQGADAQAERAALGAGNLHETALALEKADIAMRVLTTVRNRIVDAYQEVMRMTV